MHSRKPMEGPDEKVISVWHSYSTTPAKALKTLRVSMIGKVGCCCWGGWLISSLLGSMRQF